MRKLKNKFLIVFSVLLLFACYPGFVFGASAQQTEVYLGGMPAGFTLGLGGAQVVGICEVLTEDGTACPAKDAGLNLGEIIISFNGIKIGSAEDIDSVLSTFNGRKVELVVRQGSEKQKKEIIPAKDAVSGKYKLGVLIRDSVSGIGTVTYIEKGSLRFGSLGHPVAGEDGKLMDVNQGKIFRASIVNVVRGERGKAGELKGLFLNDKSIAVADKNCESGIYGNFNTDIDTKEFQSIPVSFDAQAGKASIYTTIDGIKPVEYSVSIIKVDKSHKQNKNFVLKITDKRLLEESGGIVQGMSGSPIVQNGKLIGAVTHVFLNDPTRGYGIGIENMLGN